MSNFHIGGAGWSHRVHVGDLTQAAADIRKLAGDGPVPVVSDARILASHAPTLGTIVDMVPIEIAEGEQAKDWATLQVLTERFAGVGLTRDRPIIAFGGGSVGDVAGLAASLFKRGCPVIHIPTTLLAQVDSAIGGKTAIDACGLKNLVGTFHPPTLVVCDPAFLDTLDARQLRAGYAEVVKYGLIDDRDFFGWCDSNGAALLGGSHEVRRHAVEHCVRAKARLIGDDLRDLSGRRALLNLGHTFGHAIEALGGNSPVLHGEAVAAGICLAFDLSADLGFCPAGEAARVRDHFTAVGLPVSLSGAGLGRRGAELLALMRGDKKAGAGGMALILARGIGRAFVARNVPEERVAAFLEAAG